MKLFGYFVFIPALLWGAFFIYKGDNFLADEVRSIFSEPAPKPLSDNCIDNNSAIKGLVHQHAAVTTGDPAKLTIHADTKKGMQSFIRFIDSATQNRVASILVPSSGDMVTSIPAGQYQVYFEQGFSFCNIDTGFRVKIRRIRMSSLLPISKAGTTFAILNDPTSNTGIQVSAEIDRKKVKMAPQLSEEVTETSGGRVIETSRGSLSIIPRPKPRNHAIKKAPDGHFYTSGEVNSYPVSFMIDTGATSVSLPMSMARNAGIKRCVKTSHNTANGKTMGCQTQASVKIGPYRLGNVRVSFLPNLTKPLMGMSVLNRFQMRTSGNYLEITPK